MSDEECLRNKSNDLAWRSYDGYIQILKQQSCFMEEYINIYFLFPDMNTKNNGYFNSD